MTKVYAVEIGVAMMQKGSQAELCTRQTGGAAYWEQRSDDKNLSRRDDLQIERWTSHKNEAIESFIFIRMPALREKLKWWEFDSGIFPCFETTTIDSWIWLQNKPNLTKRYSTLLFLLSKFLSKFQNSPFYRAIHMLMRWNIFLRNVVRQSTVSIYTRVVK